MEIAIPNNVQVLLNSYVKLTGCTMDMAVQSLMLAAFGEAAETHRLQTIKQKARSANFVVWADAMNAVVAIETEREKGKQEARDARHAKYLNTETKKVDYTVLAKAKNRSGYEGVYPHRDGWRAFVMEGGKGRHMRTRSLPELAAWDRYLWHKERALPYGQEEKDVDKLAKSPAERDIQLAAVRSIERWRTDGDYPNIDREFKQIATSRKINEAEFPPKKGRPPKETPVLAQREGRVTFIEDARIVVEYPDGSATLYKPLERIVVQLDQHVVAAELIGYLVGARVKLKTVKVPAPTKIMEETQVPLPKVSTTSPHYAEQLVMQRKADVIATAVSAAKETAKPVPAPPVAKPVLTSVPGPRLLLDRDYPLAGETKLEPVPAPQVVEAPLPVNELAAMTAAQKLAQFNAELLAMGDVLDDPERYTEVVNDIIKREVGSGAAGAAEGQVVSAVEDLNYDNASASGPPVDDVREGTADHVDDDSLDDYVRYGDPPDGLEDDLLDGAGDVADVVGGDEPSLDSTL